MLPEQEQRILGYFIEKAKVHLNTFEQGLLNLQNTLENTEMVNKVFRAAHSLKGGAAMLGLDSIQQTAHHLEDYFKVLKECPQIQVDQKLESLFLEVFDTLKKLLEQLEGSFCLTEDVVNNLMSEVEPVFEALDQHLKLLVNQAGSEQLQTSSVATFGWEDTSASIERQDATFDQSPLLPAAQEKIELFTAKQIAAEVKAPAAEVTEFMNEEQITALDAEIDLSDLFATKLDENEPLHEVLEPPASLNLETNAHYINLQDLEGVSVQAQAPVKELGENSPDITSSFGFSSETLAFDSLFGKTETTPVLLSTGETEFYDLFDQPKESEESLNLLEELTPICSVEDTNSIDFWEKEPEAQAQIALDSEELWFSKELPATETTLSSIETEATAATDLDVHVDNSLNTTEEFTSTFEYLWSEQPVVESNFAIDLPESGEKSVNAPLTDAQLVLHELDEVNAAPAFSRGENVDLTLDITETDSFDSLGKQSNQSLNLLCSDTADELTAEMLLDISIGVSSNEVVADEFGDLEALLGEETISANTAPQGAGTDEFFELDALLDLDTPTLEAVTEIAPATVQNLSLKVSKNQDDEFGDLEKLLEKAGKTSSSSTKVKPKQPETAATKPRRAALEQTMKVPIKQLDNVSNLVGELVVNRNSLEQDQQRMRQSLENLLHQVQQLNDLGSRMQELYERSLMEASLINIRQGSRSGALDKSVASSKLHSTGMDFDALEMDRFTGFHSLSQEMIELIVRVREASSDIEFVTDDTEQVARQFRQVTTQLQEGLMRSRMVPFSEIADRLPRAVRDISLKYGKQVELHIEGRETLIDKMLLQQLYDPMTHLVNNSITHGIETPEERAAKDKPPVGKVTIRAFHQGNQTVIAVGDDGAGIDTDQVMTKAIQKGLLTVAEARTMSRLDAYNLLFHPGFSMKDQTDEYAGRGVGMDVVRTSLSEIRGTISTDSKLGKGTTFTIRLPLTLSIGKALCCLSDKAQIAFPMDGVEDMMDIAPNNIVSNEEGQACISWRDSLLPFRPLKELLACNRQIGRGNVYGGNREDDMISIVVLRSAGTFIAVQVDQVLGEQEIVIKQFEGPAAKPVGVAGATIMGDGRIMPIADVLELIDLSMGRLQREGGASSLWSSSTAPVLPERPDVKTEHMVLIVDDSITVRELLSMTFNKAGYRVEQARDGQEAWDKLRDGLPCDLVFCDIEMPRMDGLELLSRMQKDSNFSQLPIAMLTSRGADRHRQMAVQLGASGYFTKPYLEEALLDGAQRMLNGEVLVAANSIT